MAKIIDGKAISAAVRGEIKENTQKFIAETGIQPGLAVIIVGTDPASQVYVRNKRRACEEVGFYSEAYELPETTTQAELEALVDKLNADDRIHGILCQLPLPGHLNEESILLRIDPKKDVDAFHPYNVGRIMIGNSRGPNRESNCTKLAAARKCSEGAFAQGSDMLLPCTPAGVMELIRRSGIDCTGKECVVVGRSNIVGKPMAMLLLQANGTVTICHSRTKDLSEVTRRADILVVAIGKADFVTGDMVKDGAVVIDVGMNRRADGKLTGDVDYATVEPKASYITPVPGGVGPMTITMLMRNTLTAAMEAAGRA